MKWTFDIVTEFLRINGGNQVEIDAIVELCDLKNNDTFGELAEISSIAKLHSDPAFYKNVMIDKIE